MTQKYGGEDTHKGYKFAKPLNQRVEITVQFLAGNLFTSVRPALISHHHNSTIYPRHRLIISHSPSGTVRKTPSFSEPLPKETRTTSEGNPT